MREPIKTIIDGDILYDGRLQERQTSIGSIEIKTPLNSYQNLLYNRALYGLCAYKQEDVKEMRWDKRKRIIKVHRRAQLILNLWKQEIVNQRVIAFFETFFPNARICEDITRPYTDAKYTNTLSFKDLKITREMVICKFIEEGVLPRDFCELKPVENVTA